VQAAVARDAAPQDLVQPGHIFPLQAVDGGVLMRAGHTEAGCDLAAMAGLHARRGDLRDHEGRRHHGAAARPAALCRRTRPEDRHHRRPDHYRSRTESLVEKLGQRAAGHGLRRVHGARLARQAQCGRAHRAGQGRMAAGAGGAGAVHEPLSVLDALEVNRGMHSWSLDASLKHIAQVGYGVAVFLNCGEAAEQLSRSSRARPVPSHAPERGRMDLRPYGVGAQILRECGVHRMNLMGAPRRMPSMAGYGLEVAGYTPRPNA
jgi:3,4-dihydroxy 2-butanone 4-phosphate synthase/GTP cyclohydrolase II